MNGHFLLYVRACEHSFFAVVTKVRIIGRRIEHGVDFDVALVFDRLTVCVIPNTLTSCCLSVSAPNLSKVFHSSVGGLHGDKMCAFAAAFCRDWSKKKKAVATRPLMQP